jgi:hypothetical protein
MTRRKGDDQSGDSHAYERRREFERSRGISEPRELPLDEETTDDDETGADAPGDDDEPPAEESR